MKDSNGKERKKRQEQMSLRENKVEILAPAGSYDILMADFAAGADAVYLGGAMFGARAYANNLSQEELLRALDYAHLHDKKIYLTVNTLMKQQELEDRLLPYLEPFYKAGLSAVIVQDFGAFEAIKEAFPGLHIHASTQMTVTGAAGAKLLKEAGASRVVTARELNLAEIKAIHDNCDIEIESFIHGALCYCYSGQCLLSSFQGGRSGNRGRCAQPCRLMYTPQTSDMPRTKGKGLRGDENRQKDSNGSAYLLSPKDMCGLPVLPDIIEAGVYSLKIEGRMKNVNYAAGVTGIYRKYVDRYLEYGREGFKVEDSDINDLMDLYNRGAFTTGYYNNTKGREMISLKRPNHMGTKALKVLKNEGGRVLFEALEQIYPQDVFEIDKENSFSSGSAYAKGSRFTVNLPKKYRLEKGRVLYRMKNGELTRFVEKQYVGQTLKKKIDVHLTAACDRPLELTFTDTSTGAAVTQIGAQAQAAQKQPIAEERVRKQMMRTGNSPYLFEHLQVVMDEECFLPMQSFNELRRGALEALQEKQLQDYQRKSDKSGKTGENSPEMEKVEAEKSANDGKQEKKAKLSVSIERADLFEEMLQIEGVKRIYLDSKCFLDFRMCEQIPSMAQRCQGQKKELWYIFPSLFRTKDQELWDQQMKQYMTCFDGMMVKNLEQIAYLEQIGYDGTWAADYNVYAYNKEAKAFLRNLGCSFFVCPAELTFKELKERDCDGDEMLVYGRIPVMTSTQCLKKSAGHCQKTPDLFKVRDRKGKEFPVKNCCSYCYNVIYISVPVSLHGWSEEVRKCSPASVRLAFTTESNKEAAAVAKRFVKEYLWGEELGEPGYEFTRGHYKRGVE